MQKEVEKHNKAEQLNLSNSIIIEGYEFKFKQTLAKNNISYRCKSRSCGTLLTISKDELIKINNKNDIKTLKYSINKEHTCNKTNIIKTSKIEDITTEIEIYAKAKTLIDLNIEKPLNWHF